MNRETKTIHTPKANAKIEIKTYLTGRERRQLTDVYLKKGLDINPDTHEVKGVNAELINEAQNTAWEIVVVSIDGETTDIINKILDMHSLDTEFITAEVNKITENKDFEEKKTI